jgi:hypothetical protein
MALRLCSSCHQHSLVLVLLLVLASAIGKRASPGWPGPVLTLHSLCHVAELCVSPSGIEAQLSLSWRAMRPCQDSQELNLLFSCILSMPNACTAVPLGSGACGGTTLSLDCIRPLQVPTVLPGCLGCNQCRCSCSDRRAHSWLADNTMLGWGQAACVAACAGWPSGLADGPAPAPPAGGAGGWLLRDGAVWPHLCLPVLGCRELPI